MSMTALGVFGVILNRLNGLFVYGVFSCGCHVHECLWAVALDFCMFFPSHNYCMSAPEFLQLTVAAAGNSLSGKGEFGLSVRKWTEFGGTDSFSSRFGQDENSPCNIFVHFNTVCNCKQRWFNILRE